MEIEEWKNKYEEDLKKFGFVLEKEEKNYPYITLYFKNIRDNGIFKNISFEVSEREDNPEKKILIDIYIKRNPDYYNDKYEFFTESDYLFDYLEYFEIIDKENEDNKFKFIDMWCYSWLMLNEKRW